MERREHCLSSHMSYTQLWTLWASREKHVFKDTWFRKSSSTAEIRIPGHRCWDPPVSFPSSCRFSWPSYVIIGTHSTQSASCFSDLPTAGNTALNQLGNTTTEWGVKGDSILTQTAAVKQVWLVFCLTVGLSSWQVHDADNKNRSRMITSWLCTLNNRPTQDKVNTLCKTVLSLTWKVNGCLDLCQNKVLFGSKSSCQVASILPNLPKFFFRPRRISSSADQN